MEFPSGSSEGSNYYVSISGRVGRVDDLEMVTRLTILLEYFLGPFLTFQLFDRFYKLSFLSVFCESA